MVLFVLIKTVAPPALSPWLMLLCSMSVCNCCCQSVRRPQIGTCHFVSGLLLISAAFTLTSSPQISSCHSPPASSFFLSCHFSFWSEWIFILGLAALCPPHGMYSEVLLRNLSPETPIALVSNKCILISRIISTNCCSCVSQISVSESSRNIFLIIEAETLPNSFMRPSPHLY